jgi:antitoxin MazE
MKTRIQRWGDSLALRIPASLATETGLTEDSFIDLALVAGKLVISPAPHKPSLDELLKGITPDNLHGEWDTGPDVGREVV